MPRIPLLNDYVAAKAATPPANFAPDQVRMMDTAEREATAKYTDTGRSVIDGARARLDATAAEIAAETKNLRAAHAALVRSARRGAITGPELREKLRDLITQRRALQTQFESLSTRAAEVREMDPMTEAHRIYGNPLFGDRRPWLPTLPGMRP